MTPNAQSVIGCPPVCQSSVQEKTNAPASPISRASAQVAGQELGLLQLAVPQRVHAQLAEHERLVADEVLQPEQVAAERLAVVQVDVERGEVEERQVEVLGRREVGVGDQPVRVGLLGDVGQSARNRSTRRGPCQRTTSAGISLPMLRARTEGARVTAWPPGGRRRGRRPAPVAVQEAQVLRPRDIHEDGVPGVGFEAKSALYRVMKSLAA